MVSVMSAASITQRSVARARWVVDEARRTSRRRCRSGRVSVGDERRSRRVGSAEGCGGRGASRRDRDGRSSRRPSSTRQRGVPSTPLSPMWAKRRGVGSSTSRSMAPTVGVQDPSLERRRECERMMESPARWVWMSSGAAISVGIHVVRASPSRGATPTSRRRRRRRDHRRSRGRGWAPERRRWIGFVG